MALDILNTVNMEATATHIESKASQRPGHILIDASVRDSEYGRQ